MHSINLLRLFYNAFHVNAAVNGFFNLQMYLEKRRIARTINTNQGKQQKQLWNNTKQNEELLSIRKAMVVFGLTGAMSMTVIFFRDNIEIFAISCLSCLLYLLQSPQCCMRLIMIYALMPWNSMA